MLSQFKLILNGHLGLVIIAKHSIALLEPDIALIHSAPYRAGSKTREFEKARIDMILAEFVIEPAQTKFAASYSSPKKNEILRFASTIVILTQ